jgi:serine phosphatase RsbU (regulator of sigma subunit)
MNIAMDKVLAMHQGDIPPNDLKKKYRGYIWQQTIRFGILAGILSLVFPTYFLFQDLYLLWYPVNTVPWRLLPLCFGLLLLIFCTTTLKRYTKTISVIYYLFLASIMTMMCALSILFMRYDIFGSMMNGMVIVIFVIYFGAMGGYRYLLPVYGIPFIVLVAYVALFSAEPRSHFLMLSNPFALIILALIFSEVQERIRYSRFKAHTMLERSNQQLVEKNRLIEKNQDLLQEQMKLARVIQHNIIPRTVPNTKNLDVHAIYMPMLEIGGDMYDFIHFKEPHLLGIFIADVTGHGVPAALITSMVKTLASMSGREKLAPADFLHFLNDKIIDMGSLEFISAFYSIFDANTRTLRYARAGHCPPYLIRDGELLELNARGVLLGVTRGEMFQEKELHLRPKDKIVFFTDGLVEAENAECVDFAKPFMSYLREYSALPIRELVTRIYDNLMDFRGDRRFEDDVCIVGIEVR